MVQRLLIVEDDCLMAEAAADYFTAKGWEADTEPYDSTMVELWNRVCGRPDGWPDFRSFDGYMCEFLA